MCFQLVDISLIETLLEESLRIAKGLLVAFNAGVFHAK